MTRIHLSLLRGVCQIPAYVAFQKNFFRDEGLDVHLEIVPTAWLVPGKLAATETQFAMIPWTRSAASQESDNPLVILAGSGYEEAAIVVRCGVAVEDVKSVAVPQRGGMKDLTAMGLLDALGWGEARQIRQPSGDGAILAFVGGGVDAASMIEPYATMLEQQGLGRIIRRTGDIWPGVPGCCLTTSRRLLESEPDTAQRMVRAFVRGLNFVSENAEEASEIAHNYIGIDPRFIRSALEANQPRLDGVRNREAMERVLHLMRDLGYIRSLPSRYVELRCLELAEAGLSG